MEAQPPSVALPNKLFLSGSDLHTPVDDGMHSHRPPVNGTSSSSVGTFAVKAGLAQMLKIWPRFFSECLLMVRRGYYGRCQVAMSKPSSFIDALCSAEQARIAEEAGACAVMALERVPADIRKQGGVARMSDPKMIKEIMDAVSIPVMAKVRIGHFVEAQVSIATRLDVTHPQILEAIGIDYIDESEVLTPADETHHITKHNFKVPFVCGCRNLGEALRRVAVCHRHSIQLTDACRKGRP